MSTNILDYSESLTNSTDAIAQLSCNTIPARLFSLAGYNGPARCIRVVDADTFECDVIAYKQKFRIRIRLLGVNCAETHTKNLAEKAFGILSQQYVHSRLFDKLVWCVITKEDKYKIIVEKN